MEAQNGSGTQSYIENGQSTGYSSSGGGATSCSSLDLNVDINMGAPGVAASIKCYEATKRHGWPRSIDSGDTVSPDVSF